jgi:hypothetical protein
VRGHGAEDEDREGLHCAVWIASYVGGGWWNPQ